MGLKILLATLILVSISNSHARNHYVVAPNTLRLDSDEIIGVATDGNSGGLVNIYVQDYPGKTKNISTAVLRIHSGVPQLVKIHLEAKNFPPAFLGSPGYPKFVSLNAQFQHFNKELVIRISDFSGYVFIQTDKPVYTPKETVSIRIIPLDEDMKPSNGMIRLQIKNPDGIIVDQKTFKGRDRRREKAFESHTFRFPSYPAQGEWSATILYGYNLKKNSTVRFDLKEYVLPTFAVHIQAPDVILPTDSAVNIKVSARYVYGKEVNGLVSFRLGVTRFPDFKLKIFAEIPPIPLQNGTYDLRTNLETSMRDKEIRWFPWIEKSHLFVEATVVDTATGKEEVVVNGKCRFSEKPYLISFQRCLTDFKPGRTSLVEADITFANGQPAEGISTEISATADNGKSLSILQNITKSDEEGKVAFEITPENNQETIFIKLKIVDENYQNTQVEARFQQQVFSSETSSFLTISRNVPQRLQPGDTFGRNVFVEPEGIRNIYFVPCILILLEGVIEHKTR